MMGETAKDIAMSNSTDWPLTALDALWEKIQPTPRQTDIVSRYDAGEKFVDIAKGYSITPTAVRSEYILGKRKLQAIEEWPHHHSFSSTSQGA